VSTDYFSIIALNFDWGRIRQVLRKEGIKALNYVKGIGEMEGVNVEAV
jgi:hypothetical protein